MRNLWRIFRAFLMAAWGHRKQRDKAGKRYIWHLVRVAWIAYGLQPSAEVVIIGLLHDYVEDLGHEKGGAVLKTFGYLIFSDIRWLTHLREVSYPEYIRHLLYFGSDVARAVKLADLLDNTQPGRITVRQPVYGPDGGPYDKGNVDECRKRGERYYDAIEALARQRVQQSWGVI